MYEYQSKDIDYRNTYEMSARYEAALRTIFDEAAAISKERYATTEQVTERLCDTMRGWQQFGDVMYFTARNILVQCEGAGVYVPAVDITALNEGDGRSGFTISYESEHPHRPLEFLETVDGYYSGATGGVIQCEDGMYRPQVVMTFRSPQTTSFSAPVESRAIDTTLFEAGISSSFLVECGENAALQFPMNERITQFQRSVDTIALSGLSKTRFLSTIHKLSALVWTETEEGYQEVRHIERLRWLGRNSEQYMTDPKVQEAFLDALASRLADRTVYVTRLSDGRGDGEAPEEFGRIADVLIVQDDTQAYTPAISLERAVPDNDVAVVNIPLKEIASLRF